MEMTPYYTGGEVDRWEAVRSLSVSLVARCHSGEGEMWQNQEQRKSPDLPDLSSFMIVSSAEMGLDDAHDTYGNGFVSSFSSMFTTDTHSTTPQTSQVPANDSFDEPPPTAATDHAKQNSDDKTTDDEAVVPYGFPVAWLPHIDMKGAPDALRGAGAKYSSASLPCDVYAKNVILEDEDADLVVIEDTDDTQSQDSEPVMVDICEHEPAESRQHAVLLDEDNGTALHARSVQGSSSKGKTAAAAADTAGSAAAARKGGKRAAAGNKGKGRAKRSSHPRTGRGGGRGGQDSEDSSDDERRRKRKRQEPADKPDDDEPEEVKADKPLFACPFCKREPVKFEGCYSVILRRMNYVVQHLVRRHTAPENGCHGCGRVFGSGAALERHRPRCAPAAGFIAPWVTAEQLARCRERRAGGATPADHWYFVYDTLFPDSPFRPTTPYQTHSLDDMLILMEQEGPPVVLQALEDARRLGLSDAEIAQRLMRRVRAIWLRSHDLPPETNRPSPGPATPAAQQPLGPQAAPLPAQAAPTPVLQTPQLRLPSPPPRTAVQASQATAWRPTLTQQQASLLPADLRPPQMAGLAGLTHLGDRQSISSASGLTPSSSSPRASPENAGSLAGLSGLRRHVSASAGAGPSGQSATGPPASAASSALAPQQTPVEDGQDEEEEEDVMSCSAKDPNYFSSLMGSEVEWAE